MQDFHRVGNPEEFGQPDWQGGMVNPNGYQRITPCEKLFNLS